MSSLQAVPVAGGASRLPSRPKLLAGAAVAVAAVTLGVPRLLGGDAAVEELTQLDFGAVTTTTVADDLEVGPGPVGGANPFVPKIGRPASAAAATVVVSSATTTTVPVEPAAAPAAGPVG